MRSVERARVRGLWWTQKEPGASARWLGWGFVPFFILRHFIGPFINILLGRSWELSLVSSTESSAKANAFSRVSRRTLLFGVMRRVVVRRRRLVGAQLWPLAARAIQRSVQ